MAYNALDVLHRIVSHQVVRAKEQGIKSSTRDALTMTIGEFFTFQGRFTRSTFWKAIIGIFVFDAFIGFMANQTRDEGVLLLFGISGAVISIWGGLATQVKRWHDRGKSGWMVLINLLPVIGSLWTLIELGMLPGTTGPNPYGGEATHEPSSAHEVA